MKPLNCCLYLFIQSKKISGLDGFSTVLSNIHEPVNSYFIQTVLKMGVGRGDGDFSLFHNGSIILNPELVKNSMWKKNNYWKISLMHIGTKFFKDYQTGPSFEFYIL